MVTAKNVVWTEAAKKDLYHIYTRIAGKSTARAKEVAQSILSKTASLHTDYPQGTPEPLLKRESEPYKFVTASFYKILYSIVEEKVMIKTLYHVRQDPVV